VSEELSAAERRRALSATELESLRTALDPEAELVGSRPLVGGVDTATYALRLRRAAAPAGERKVVLRVFRAWEGDVAAKVRQEFATLEAVSASMTLAPRPLLCDAAGVLIGEPLIVMTMLEGAPLPPPIDPRAWTEQLARALIAIHEIPLSAVQAIPRDRTAAEGIARRIANPPPQPDPLWDEVVAVLPSLATGLAGNPPVLVHGDLWFGNTTWRHGRLTGVVDWAGARIGDPARDIAIARADLRLFSGERSADVFLERYASVRGHVNDIPFWDLWAALGPIRWLRHWLAGYEELGVALSFDKARARLEEWVRLLLRHSMPAR
jgi:aminoglycoside phosphotransferase (APT) family kinase protein